MGMFFDEEKKKPDRVQQKPVGVLEIIVDGLVKIIIMFFGALLTAMLWIGKNVFGQYFVTLGHLLDFRGLEREVATRRIAMAFFIIIIFPGAPLFFLYRVPAVRDYLTLSRNVTVNVPMPNKRIFFPDRSFFVPEEKRKLYDFISSSAPGPYFTFPEHKEGEEFIVPSGHCQGVTRGRTIKVSSKTFAIGAEGFTREVTYHVTYTVNELLGMEYALELFIHPRYLIRNEKELAIISTTVKRTKSWEKFEKDWPWVRAFPDGYKDYEIQADPYQHAIICF